MMSKRIEELRELLSNMSECRGHGVISLEDDDTRTNITINDVAQLAYALTEEANSRVIAEKECEKWESETNRVMDELEALRKHFQMAVDGEARKRIQPELDQIEITVRQACAKVIRDIAGMMAHEMMAHDDLQIKARRVYYALIRMANEAEQPIPSKRSANA